MLECRNDISRKVVIMYNLCVGFTDSTSMIDAELDYLLINLSYHLQPPLSFNYMAL